MWLYQDDCYFSYAIIIILLWTQAMDQEFQDPAENQDKNEKDADFSNSDFEAEDCC